MENASKALLIAAAVLVTIIIITVGIKVYTSSSETGKVATSTGKTISDKTAEATGLAKDEITGNKIKYYSGETETTKNKNDVIPGDTIKIGSERFMIFFKGIEEDETSSYHNKEIIKAMPYYNLKLDSYPIKQVTSDTTSNAGIIQFSTTNYWSKIEGWDSGAVDGAIDVDMYNEANKIQRYITDYKTTLYGLGVEGIEVRAARRSEVNTNSVSYTMRNPGMAGAYWLGSAGTYHSQAIYGVGRSGSNFGTGYYNCGRRICRMWSSSNYNYHNLI